MNNMNNRSAAGLRRSAIAERIRLREEWSELKGTLDVPQTDQTKPLRKQNLYKNTLTKQRTCQNVQIKKNYVGGQDFSKSMQANSEVLHGVVALVDVGSEPRALALRAALTALGATVVPNWSPLVTHLIWSQGGCRATRAKSRALACRVVSALWVEACAAAARRLPEQAFPAAARASDLPSPRTLRQLLKKAEMENIPLLDLLSDDKEEDRENRPARLRLSSETDHDTSADTSHNSSKDTSRDKSRDTTTDIESRVNTAPRRALPHSSAASPRPSKSRRKLFTQKEAELLKRSDEESDAEPSRVARAPHRRLARAERLARKLVAACGTHTTPRGPTAAGRPVVVLTGMDRGERHVICDAVRRLSGRVQAHVSRKTTHVLLGSFNRTESSERNCSGVTALNITNKTINNHVINTSSTKTNVTRTSPRNKTTSLRIIIEKSYNNNVTKSSTNVTNTSDRTVIDNRYVTNTNADVLANNNVTDTSARTVTNICEAMRVVHRSELQKARTLNALLGAARGCRVLNAQWALDSLANNNWLHHHGYEVPHLKKISQKARTERTALGKLRSEYAYDVFYGMKVRVTPNAEQKDAATQLLTLCGAVLQDGGRLQDGGCTQNGGRDFDLTVGVNDGEVSSKWVFDSVAAARMRTTRRYINNRLATQNTQGSVI